MKQENLNQVVDYIDDRNKICGWLRSIDYDVTTGCKTWERHEKAIEWLMKYRRSEMIAVMEPLLHDMLEIVNKTLIDLGVELAPPKIKYEDDDCYLKIGESWPVDVYSSRGVE